MKINKTFVCLSILAAIGILWRSYPHILIPRLFPSGESNNLAYVFWLVNHGGRAYDVFHVPHLEFYLVYFLHLLGANVERVSFVINPIIGGCSVFAFYFFISKIISQKGALRASALFTFSETMFYRTCHFGSTEALGIFFMFVFFGLYVRKHFISSILILAVVPLAHVLPFLFIVLVVCLDLLLKGKILPALMICTISLIFLFNSFISPHRALTKKFLESISFSRAFSKMFLFSPLELVVSSRFYLGTVMMLLLALVGFRKWERIEQEMILVSLVMFVGSTLFYDAGVISPMRITPYISIPLFSICAKVITKKSIIIGLVVSMIVSPLIGGTDRFVWLSDAITEEEIVAIEWFEAEGHFEQGRIIYLYCDLPVKQYVQLYSYKKVNITHPKYVFISERMSKRSFSLIMQEGKRTLDLRVPMEDVWSNSPSWKLIYDEQGVKIYERRGIVW